MLAHIIEKHYGMALTDLQYEQLRLIIVEEGVNKRYDIPKVINRIFQGEVQELHGEGPRIKWQEVKKINKSITCLEPEVTTKKYWISEEINECQQKFNYYGDEFADEFDDSDEDDSSIITKVGTANRVIHCGYHKEAAKYKVNRNKILQLWGMNQVVNGQQQAEEEQALKRVHFNNYLIVSENTLTIRAVPGSKKSSSNFDQYREQSIESALKTLVDQEGPIIDELLKTVDLGGLSYEQFTQAYQIGRALGKKLEIPNKDKIMAILYVISNKLGPSERHKIYEKIDPSPAVARSLIDKIRSAINKQKLVRNKTACKVDQIKEAARQEKREEQKQRGMERIQRIGEQKYENKFAGLDNMQRMRYHALREQVNDMQSLSEEERREYHQLSNMVRSNIKRYADKKGFK